MATSFFLRFRWSDAAALDREIGKARLALAAAHDAGDASAEIEMACRLGTALIAADREAAAAELLSGLLPKAQTLNDPAHAAWILHHLATAEQYCGDRELAQTHFGAALDIATTHEFIHVEHFVWHHRGRCYAEQGEIARARNCFEKALAIRRRLGDPRAEKTQQAIDLLDAL
jgi:tetratricopeptide (TPR) repeat protein